MHRILAMLALAATIIYVASPFVASADQLPDFDVPSGHFYTQANGSPDGPSAGGFLITDANGVPFRSFFNQQGGPDVLGYPASTRFTWDGYVCQATQRAILQYNASTGQVQLANLFDYLSGVGQDDWLWSRRLAPRPSQPTAASSDSQPQSFLELAHLRFNWLYNDAPIFHRYFHTPSYYAVFGLPTSPVEDLGQYYAERFQRVVLYHWKAVVPWADSSGVSVGLGGDLFKELGLIPTDATHPVPTTTTDEGTAPLPAIYSLPQLPGPTAPLIQRLVTKDPASPAPTNKTTIVAATPTTAAVTAAPPSATPSTAAPIATPAPVPQLPVLVGVATWYGADFQGQPMYDGQIYNMYDPTTTAANLYPIGTWLRVTRLSTGQSIIVQVTDRGAFRYPDIVDLSYAAFSMLADPGAGVIGVRVEPVSGP